MAKFSNVLPGVLSRLKNPLDWVFIDGDHTYSGTMDYFKQIMNHSCPDTVLILHDIHWSPDMEKAWEEIKAHPKVKVTLDLFYMGIVFFRSELSRQHFLLRF
jgi:predicted O-methyltransferase YrrM